MSDDRQGSGFVHISQILPGFERLISPEPSDAPPTALTAQRQYHFTRQQQIDTLARLGEDPHADMGFMTRLLTLCSLPRTDPGRRLQYKRENGPYTLVIMAGGDNQLPFGNIPRLLLAWVSTRAVRTQQRELVLGPSLASFMRQLGMCSDSGGPTGNRTRLRTQIDRLFHAHIQLIYHPPGRKMTASSPVAEYTDLWWDDAWPEAGTRREGRIRLGEAFYREIVAHPVPLDMNILRAVKRSSLSIDLYLWLSYKTYSLYVNGKRPERLSWSRLYRQFGSSPEKADDKFVVRNFRKDVLRELAKLKSAWRSLDVATPTGCLEIRACAPSVPPKDFSGDV